MTRNDREVEEFHGFVLSYYSETSAAIMVKKEIQHKIVGEDHEYIVAEATHPMEGVGIECWFHFGNGAKEEVKATVRIRDSERDAVLAALKQVGDQLFSGAERLIEDQRPHCSDTYMQFHNDLLWAFLTGCVDTRADFHEGLWLEHR